MILRFLPIMMATSLWAEIVVEAKQDGVKILQEAKKDAPELASLKKGESVEASERKGMYWQVKVNGKDGFVLFTTVTRREGKPSALAAAIGKAAQESRDMDAVKGARSRTSVMGIRGLDETSETSSAGNVSPNMRLVYNMEDRVVTKKRVERLGDLVQSELAGRLKDDSAE